MCSVLCFATNLVLVHHNIYIALDAIYYFQLRLKPFTDCTKAQVRSCVCVCVLLCLCVVCIYVNGNFPDFGVPHH